MANMQIAIRLRRETGVYCGVLTTGQIFIDDLTDKVVGRASASLIVDSSKRKQRITAYDLISGTG